MTEATEFWKIYKLDVIAVPDQPAAAADQLSRRDLPHRAREVRRHRRRDRAAQPLGHGRAERRQADRSARSPGRDRRRDRDSAARHQAARDDSARARSTTSSAAAGRSWSAPSRSRRASGSQRMLDKRGIKHQVLNAKHHKREAEIVAQAGRKAAVTIATNMAGRGTDIILGGNAETMAWALLQDKYATRLDVPQDEWTDAGHARSKQREKMKAEGARGRRARRPAHHRHRAARSPPHRPAAPRPLRPPGRPRQQPVLPVARRRPDADLRRRVGQERPHPARHAGRRGDRKPDGHPPHRRAPRRRSKSATSTSARTCSNTTR